MWVCVCTHILHDFHLYAYECIIRLARIRVVRMNKWTGKTEHAHLGRAALHMMFLRVWACLVAGWLCSEMCTRFASFVVCNRPLKWRRAIVRRSRYCRQLSCPTFAVPWAMAAIRVLWHCAIIWSHNHNRKCSRIARHPTIGNVKSCNRMHKWIIFNNRNSCSLLEWYLTRGYWVVRNVRTCPFGICVINVLWLCSFRATEIAANAFGDKINYALIIDFRGGCTSLVSAICCMFERCCTVHK